MNSVGIEMAGDIQDRAFLLLYHLGGFARDAVRFRSLGGAMAREESESLAFLAHLLLFLVPSPRLL